MNDNVVASEVEKSSTPRPLRVYESIWVEVLRRATVGDDRPIRIQVPELTAPIFARLKKAFYKEKDLDPAGKEWRSQIWKGSAAKGSENVVFFSVIPKDMKDRI